MRKLSILWMGLGLILGPMQDGGAGATTNATVAEAGASVPLFIVADDGKVWETAALNQDDEERFAYLPVVLTGYSGASPQPTATSIATFTSTPTTMTTATTTPSSPATSTATPTATATTTVAPSATSTTAPASPTPAATSVPEVTPTPTTDRCRIENGRFEEVDDGEAPPWVQEGTHAGTMVEVAASAGIGAAPAGPRAAYFGGESLSHDVLYQAIAIPMQATSVTLSAWYYVHGGIRPASTALNVELRNTDQQLLQSIDTVDLGDRNGQWFRKSSEVDLSPWAGQTLLLYFDFNTDRGNAMFMDDVRFNACVP